MPPGAISKRRNQMATKKKATKAAKKGKRLRKIKKLNAMKPLDQQDYLKIHLG